MPSKGTKARSRYSSLVRLPSDCGLPPFPKPTITGSFLVCQHLAFSNPLYFHQHNGELNITILFFNNIMESLISVIFSTCVFNNIMEVTFILPPPRFSPPGSPQIYNSFRFKYIWLCGFSALKR